MPSKKSDRKAQLASSVNVAFVYTDAMRARAERRIVAKLDHEDTARVHREYMEVMFGAMLRRIAAAEQRGELPGLIRLPSDADLPPLMPSEKRPRKKWTPKYL